MKLDGRRVLFGIGGVDSVDTGPLEQNFGFDLDAPECGGRIGREVGVSGPSGDNTT